MRPKNEETEQKPDDETIRHDRFINDGLDDFTIIPPEVTGEDEDEE